MSHHVLTPEPITDDRVIACPKCGAQLAIAKPGDALLIHEADGSHVYEPARFNS